MTLITVYARREPTTDAVILQYAPTSARKKHDIVIYRDKAATEIKARFSWYLNRPRQNQKTVMLNCCRWNLEWI